MRNYLRILMAFYIIVGLVAAFYPVMNSYSKEALVASQSDEEEADEEWYDANERPLKEDSVQKIEVDNKSIKEEKSEEEKEEEKDTKEEEIKPDKNFEEFDIEEEDEESGYADPFTVNKDKVNVRMEANSSSDIITVVERGQIANMIEKGESWSKIEFGGSTGYMGTSHVVLKSENPDEYQKWIDYRKEQEQKAKEQEELETQTEETQEPVE